MGSEIAPQTPQIERALGAGPRSDRLERFNTPEDLLTTRHQQRRFGYRFSARSISRRASA